MDYANKCIICNSGNLDPFRGKIAPFIVSKTLDIEWPNLDVISCLAIL